MSNPSGGILFRLPFWGETVFGFSGYQRFDNNVTWTLYDPIPSYSDSVSLPDDQYRTNLDVVSFQLTNPTPTPFVSLIAVGHSDRQDRSDFSCDQRRSSEIEASTARAVSAWEWIKARVTEKAAEQGVDAGEWWETSPFVTWGLVFAATGMLKHPQPADEQQRLENRRVTVLVSIFNEV